MTLRIALLLALVVVPAAGAQAGGAVQQAAQSLQSDPVYVHPDAEAPVTAEQVAELRRRIADAGGGIYVAALPEAAANEAGSPEALLNRLAGELGRRGTYAVVAGTRFRVASNGGPERREAAAIANDAVQANRDDGAAGIGPALLDFVAGVADVRGGEARAGAAENEDGGGTSGATLGILAAAAAAVAGVFAWRRRKRQAAEFHEVREASEEDLLALADDVRALDLDIELPGADPRAREDYGRAVDSYERASAAFTRARRPAELEQVSAAVEEGRWAMTAAKARLAGDEPPERRPPCFFDPRHGPSVRDVEWAPPGGEPRPVPACAADAIRAESGEEPESRQVLVGGRRTPYWNAGPAYGPWAGGFFGGAAGTMLPMLFVGSMLGSGFGFGDPGAGSGEGDGFDDTGGGDFGSGGGDFGGGDFGGGDFGGGDF